MTAACGSCGAPVLWVVTEAGTREPLDAEPVPHGNIEIVETIFGEDGKQEIRVRHLKKGEAESVTLFEPPPRYVSHFSSCPDAAKYRRR